MFTPCIGPPSILMKFSLFHFSSVIIIQTKDKYTIRMTERNMNSASISSNVLTYCFVKNAGSYKKWGWDKNQSTAILSNCTSANFQKVWEQSTLPLFSTLLKYWAIFFWPTFNQHWGNMCPTNCWANIDQLWLGNCFTYNWAFVLPNSWFINSLPPQWLGKIFTQYWLMNIV